jgi:hypothetical protein
VNARCLGSAQYGTQVVRIFDTVKKEKEGGFVAHTRGLQYPTEAAVRSGRDERNDPLMLSIWDETVECGGGPELHRNPVHLGLLNQVAELPIQSQDEESLYGSATGSKSFSDRMQSVEELRWLTASICSCHPVCPQG